MSDDETGDIPFSNGGTEATKPVEENEEEEEEEDDEDEVEEGV
jgi:hypothetical protein